MPKLQFLVEFDLKVSPSVGSFSKLRIQAYQSAIAEILHKHLACASQIDKLRVDRYEPPVPAAPQELNIVITGNPVDGFFYHGPFSALSEDASQWADDSDYADFWVTKLTPPGKCDFCGEDGVHLVAALEGDPDQHVCPVCHADPNIPTEELSR